jgi:isoleucyl-tRNA synthetase
MAPITPFVTERVWQDLVVPVDPHAPGSVHLAAFPEVDESLLDPRLSDRMALTRRLVELGRTARAESGMKVRQPLSRVLASAAGFADLPDDLLAEIAAELNVGTVAPVAGSFVQTTAKANFRTLGRRFGKGVQQVAKAVAEADAAALRQALLAAGTATVVVDGAPIALGPDEVVITETPQEGWAVASDGGATVALDLSLTPDLRRAGLARDAIRQIQEARKASGLEVSDRIELRYVPGTDDAALALTEHGALVADEVLAVDYAAGEPAWPDPRPFTDETIGLTFWLRKA